jgi:hypothetical protein
VRSIKTLLAAAATRFAALHQNFLALKRMQSLQIWHCWLTLKTK